MTSQWVERTWIRTGGYGRFRGEWVNLKFNLTCNTHTPLIWTLSIPLPSVFMLTGSDCSTVIIVIILMLLVSLAKALVNTSSTTFYDYLNFSLCDGSVRNLLFPPPPLLAQVTHCSVFRESSLSMMYDVACYSCNSQLMYANEKLVYATSAVSV